MNEEKRISIEEAKNQIVNWVKTADGTAISTLLERTFGVIARQESESSILLKPAIDYRDAFGEFDTFAGPRRTPCECVEVMEIKVFENGCICEREATHSHCKKCGGLRALYKTSKSSIVYLIPKIFGKEAANPINAIFKENFNSITLDMSETIFVDSHSIGNLVQIKNKADQEGVNLEVLLNPKLRPQFKMTQLDQLFNIKEPRCK